MTNRLAALLLVTAGIVLTSACGSAESPASPSRASTTASATLDAFLGTWSSSPAASSGSSGVTLPDSCGDLQYVVEKSADGQSATVRFNGTCAGITASGTGRGSLAGTVLTWGADGSATYRGVACTFRFDNGTATREGDGVRLTYAGTVCGAPVRGSELLRRTP